MKIRKLQIKGYKRFTELTIDLGKNPKRIIALIGPNGCGKSCVFDSFLCLPSFYGSGIGSNQTIDKQYHSNNPEINIQPKDIVIEFDDGKTYQDKRNFYSQTGKDHTIFAFRGPHRYCSSLNVSNTESIPDIKNNSIGASNCSQIDDKLIFNYKLLDAQIRKYMDDKDVRPSEAREYYLNLINNSLEKCLGMKITNLGNIGLGDGTMHFRKSDQNRDINFNVLSSGEKEIVDILLDIIVKRDAYSESIFIIDEPELHINASIQKSLLIEINKLIPKDCQIWIATHSIGFIRALEEDFKDDSQIIKFEYQSASEPITLVEMERTRYNFLELYKTAVDDLSELIAPRTIVYCEGNIQGNKEGRDSMCYNIIFNKKYPDTLFISSGGCKEDYTPVALKIINHAFVGVNLIRLVDRDEKTNEERNSFLEEKPMNRMLKRREIENYLFDYSVFHKRYPQVSEDRYRAVVGDIKYDDVKSQTVKLKELVDYRGTNKDFCISLAKVISEEMDVYQELESVIMENDPSLPVVGTLR